MTWEDNLASRPAPAPAAYIPPHDPRAAALHSMLRTRPAGPSMPLLRVTPANTYPKTPSPRDVALANQIGRNLQQHFSQNGGAIPRNTADPHNLLFSA